jgi:hypothetical protein
MGGILVACVSWVTLPSFHARFISWFFNPPVAWLSPEKVVIKMGLYPISRQTEIVVVSYISYYIPIYPHEI